MSEGAMQTDVLSTKRFDVYRAVTDRIVEAIEAGAGEFVMPWHRAGPGLGRPTNAATRMKYQGVNVVALWAEAAALGYGSGWWATFEQWKGLGVRVRRGEHGATIVFYKRFEQNREEAEDEERGPRLLARAFRVFNSDQVDGWQPPEATPSNLAETLEQVEAFVRLTGAKVRHGGSAAFYQLKEDMIHMPDRGVFAGSPTSTPTETYYSTLLHELTHWTGAKHRLDRQFGERFGDEAYAVEELVAELGAAFLCADLEIANEPRLDHAQYLSHWLRVLAADRRAIFTAAKRAGEAAAYLSSFVDGAPPT
jgi:antirestriction protein ArdC